MKRWIFFFTHSLKLRYKLLLSFFIVLLPMAMLSVVIYTNSYHALFSQALYSAEQIFTQTKTSLENTINRYDVLTFSLSTLNELTKKYDDEPLTANQMIAARNALEKSKAIPHRKVGAILPEEI